MNVPEIEAVLPLSAGPTSAQAARRWAVAVCEALDREDLVECTRLAVSELVTNAVLHADPPFTLRRGGTAVHPRFEITDGSTRPPTPDTDLPDADALWTTVGRGLTLVATCSQAWGAQIHAGGKSVWFVPRSEFSDAEGVEMRLEYLEEVPHSDSPITDPVHVRLERLDPTAYREFRLRVRELQRELRLLTLAHATTYPAASSLAALLEGFERDPALGQAWDSVTDATSGHEEPLDLEVVVDRSALPRVAEIRDVLELADAFSRTERLLATEPTPTQSAFMRWFLGEFGRQGDGAAPVPWTEVAPG